jgi:adenylate kinase family enzyme
MKPLHPPVKSIAIIGPTGSGKTPLGNYIAGHGINGKRCVHFDFGHELRSISNHGTPPGGYTKKDIAFIQDVLSGGLLLENEHFPIARKIINIFMTKNCFEQDNILILNGLPRHVGQAEDIKVIAKVESLIVLECTAEDVFSRIQENKGEDRTDRIDDDIKMVEEKLRIFWDRTRPLVDYYSRKGSRVFTISVSVESSAQELYTELASSLIAI